MCRRSGRPKEARKWYEKALAACKELDALNPGNQQFMEAHMALLHGMAVLAMNEDKLDEGVRYLRKAVAVGKRKQRLFDDAKSELDLATLERTLAFALDNQSNYGEASTREWSRASRTSSTKIPPTTGRRHASR